MRRAILVAVAAFSLATAAAARPIVGGATPPAHAAGAPRPVGSRGAFAHVGGERRGFHRGRFGAYVWPWWGPYDLGDYAGYVPASDEGAPAPAQAYPWAMGPPPPPAAPICPELLHWEPKLHRATTTKLCD